MRLVRNAIQCKKCLDIIESKWGHHFVRCKCGAVFVDGGSEYSRRGWPEGNANDYILDLCEYESE